MGKQNDANTLSQSESADTDAWPSYVDLLAPYVEQSTWMPGHHKNDPQLRQELNRFLFFLSSMGYFGVLYQDTRYPDFWPVYNQAFPLGLHNPDDAYYMAVVDDDGVYKISGYRGTVRILEFQIGAARMQAYGSGSFKPAVSDYDIDKGVHIAADGSFEVVLSPTRPQGYHGDWWELKPDAALILVRQRAYDWLGEEDGRLAIERLDVPAMRPRASASEIESRVKQHGGWMKNYSKLMANWPVKLREAGLVNKVDVYDLSKAPGLDVEGGLDTQRYVQGLFELGPDEALILETELPESCRYWMFHLLDELMSSLDVLNRQTSLNEFQSNPDADGKFRAVISAIDPGVPNWLDTIGYSAGVIMGRWWDASSFPLPTLRKVKVADVRQYLPEDTPTVSAEERDAIIRLRRKGAQLRRRW